MKLISIEKLKEFLQTGQFNLQPTQRKLCFPIIQRIFHKMNPGVQFENINIKDELLINGHHRYICSLLLQKNINTNSWQSSSQMIVCKWPEMEVDENDWESIEIIERHNSKDAAASGLDINAFKI